MQDTVIWNFNIMKIKTFNFFFKNSMEKNKLTAKEYFYYGTKDSCGFVRSPVRSSLVTLTGSHC